MEENASNDYTTQPSIGGSAGEMIASEQAEQTALEEAEQALKDEIKRFKFKYKANEEEVEEELDEEEIKQRLSFARGAAKKMSDAEHARRQVMELANLMKTDPEMALKNLGWSQQDLRGWLEKKLSGFVEEDLLSPEERQLRKEKEELRKYRQQEELMRKEQERRKALQLKQESQAKMESDIMSAIEKSDLPQDPEVKTQILLDMAKLLYADRAHALRNGINPRLTVEAALDRARQQYSRSIETLLTKYNVDTLYEMLEKSGKLKEIRKKDLAKVRTVPNSKNTAGTGNTSPVKNEERKPVNEREWVKRIRGEL